MVQSLSRHTYLRITVLREPGKRMILNSNLPPTATAQTRRFSLMISFGNVNKYYLAEDLFNFTLEILNKNFIFYGVS